MKAKFLPLMTGKKHVFYANNQAHLRSDYPDTVFKNAGSLIIGKSTEEANLIHRAAMQFPTVLVAEEEILKAELELYMSGKTNTYEVESIEMQFYEIWDDWQENTATWNSMAQYRTEAKYTTKIKFADIILEQILNVEIDKSIIKYLCQHGMLITSNEEEIPWETMFGWAGIHAETLEKQPKLAIFLK